MHGSTSCPSISPRPQRAEAHMYSRNESGTRSRHVTRYRSISYSQLTIFVTFGKSIDFIFFVITRKNIPCLILSGGKIGSSREGVNLKFSTPPENHTSMFQINTMYANTSSYSFIFCFQFVRVTSQKVKPGGLRVS